jgi:hypothetical protein
MLSANQVFYFPPLARISFTRAVKSFLACANSRDGNTVEVFEKGGGGSLIQSGLNFRIALFVVTLVAAFFVTIVAPKKETLFKGEGLFLLKRVDNIALANGFQYKSSRGGCNDQAYKAQL